MTLEKLLTPLLLFYCLKFSSPQDISDDIPTPQCIFSRLDVVPCMYRNIQLQQAGENEYSVHYTRLRLSHGGFVECIVRATNQTIQPISTTDAKIIYSPGFRERLYYENQLLVQYNINCGENDTIFYNITQLDLQPPDCTYDGHPRCQDYILIDHGPGGSTEICGDFSTNRHNLLHFTHNNALTIYFRTSESTVFKGFEMYLHCIKPNSCLEACIQSHSNLNNCFCRYGGGNCSLSSAASESFNDSFCIECTQMEDECVCNDGFERDRENERLCRDIDECASSRDNCDENSLCHNTVGSFSCVCDDGFVGDGTVCTDLVCSASGISEVTIDCSGIEHDTSLQCSFDGGPLHTCNMPMVLTTNVSPPGSHSVRIVASTSGEDSVSYTITSDMDTHFLAASVPSLKVILIEGSPHVIGDTVTAEFVTSRPVVGVRCFLRYKNQRDYRDCFAGRVSFTGLKSGRYILKISAYNRQTDVATLKMMVNI